MDTREKLTTDTQKLYAKHIGKLFVFTQGMLIYPFDETNTENPIGYPSESSTGDFFILCDAFTRYRCLEVFLPYVHSSSQDSVVLKILKSDRVFYVWHWVDFLALAPYMHANIKLLTNHD